MGRENTGKETRTWTSCALTGLVATTLRAGAEEWKDLGADTRRPLARDFLSMAAEGRGCRERRWGCGGGAAAKGVCNETKVSRRVARALPAETPFTAETNHSRVISTPHLAPHLALATFVLLRLFHDKSTSPLPLGPLSAVNVGRGGSRARRMNIYGTRVYTTSRGSLFYSRVSHPTGRRASASAFDRGKHHCQRWRSLAAMAAVAGDS